MAKGTIIGKNHTLGSVPVNVGHLSMMHQGIPLGPGIVMVNAEVAADLRDAVERHNDAEGRLDTDMVDHRVSGASDPRLADLNAANESGYAALQAQVRADNAEKALAELQAKAKAAGISLDDTEDTGKSGAGDGTKVPSSIPNL